jgi:hypothetical protein
MKIFLFLAALTAFASSSEIDTPGVKFFSVCGRYDPPSRMLRIREGDKVEILEGSSAPAESGTYCFRGASLRFVDGEGIWEFRPESHHLVVRMLQYPVLTCSVLEKEAFQTVFNGDRLEFGGTPPARGKEYGWCADGRSLPVKTKTGWKLEPSRFREMPDPHLRSGMSIGNQ